ncbi:glycosyltransferase family 2 protein [Nocardioides rubriscoriae]|uniref:glycosyltransferase family 2 protein n=1 Tax=Nocardioides rubriscoriae TaxID=642762 RepID=UPI0011DF02F5|nr:galactosyltransferase-related protein [Nocardioides rubriscoriae]
MTGSTTTIGVLTLAHGRRDRLAAQHLTLALGRRRPDLYTVVAMGDPLIRESDDRGLHRDVVHVDVPADGLPLATARNRGVEHLVDRGADVVVLLDVDCLAGFSLVSAYADAACAHPDRLWSGPVTYLPPDVFVSHPAELAAHDAPHPARPAPRPGQVEESTRPELFWSLSFAVTPTTWERIGGFDEAYVGYGGEDTDLARRAEAAGVRSWWLGSARAYHQHHRVSSPPVEHLDAILRNGRTYHQRWGEWPMLGWLRDFEARGLVRRDGDQWVKVRPDG